MDEDRVVDLSVGEHVGQGIQQLDYQVPVVFKADQQVVGDGRC